MHVISKKPLREFWEDHPDSEMPLKAWHAEVKKVEWRTWADIKAKYGSADSLKEGRVVFNIGGNKFRLIVRVNYAVQVVYIRFIGTHADYDKIDANSV